MENETKKAFTFNFYEKKTPWVYDAVYASLSRVEDTLHYINSLDLTSEGSSKQRSAFVFLI